MTALLYRGGMCGDLILAMIDPNALKKRTGYNDKITDSVINDYRYKPARYIMKKFHLYDSQYKQKYTQKLHDQYYLTHDTDWCQQTKDRVVQVVCENKSLHKWFARRFEKIYTPRPHIIQEAYNHIEQTNNFVSDYANSIAQWQQAFMFENRFDISDLHDTNFVERTLDYFGCDNYDWAMKIYSDWVQSSINQHYEFQ